ncbi:MAG: patatin-like phospholipase family protein [Eubacterium sp.]|nr:patatin-like phospholipase family protein [Eubacterium sp.]
MLQKNLKIGLALAGGGGKGAYQIGVWQALRECSLDQMVDAVAGTSVGGLNAALFVQGDFEKAAYIWEHIKPEQILSKQEGSLLQQALAGIYDGIAGYAGAFFSRDGLEQIIGQYLDLDLFTQARLDCYLTGCRVKTDLLYHLKETEFGGDTADSLSFSPYIFPKAEYFKMRDETRETRRRILLATSAIPVVFQDVKIRGNYYLDGGLVDNVPVTPLFEQAGCDVVVAVLLGGGSTYQRLVPQGKRCLEIRPTQEQGGMITGTLDFHAKHAKRRIEQGYADAMPVFSKIREDIDREKRLGNVIRSEQQEEMRHQKEAFYLKQGIASQMYEIERLKEKDSRRRQLWDGRNLS